MNDQNPNPNGTDADEPPVFTKSEMSAIVQQRLAQDRARRGNPPPASTAAPAASGADPRLDRIEGALSTMASVLERLAPPAGAPAPSAPAAAPAVRYEQFAAPGGEMRTVTVQNHPAAAPSAPTPHMLPSNSGLVDIWNLSPPQIDQLGPAGIRAEFERHKEVGDRLSGRPQKPRPPFSLNADGSRR